MLVRLVFLGSKIKRDYYGQRISEAQPTIYKEQEVKELGSLRGAGAEPREGKTKENRF